MKPAFKHSLTTALVLIVVMVFIGQVVAGDRSVGLSGNAQLEKGVTNTSRIRANMKLRVTANNHATVFELNESRAARDLFIQLPLNVKVENYSDNEKIFYPPKKLDTSGAPQADAKLGTLAYYAPWGDVVMFYGSFGSATGLYELGYAVSGSEHISAMAGIIRIEKE